MIREAEQSASGMGLAGFTGRVAVVTGSASGIGLQTAELLTELGARVAGLDLRAGSDVIELFCETDVSDEASVGRAFARIEDEVGVPQIVVTSAGVFTPQPLASLDPDLWRHTLEVNLTGTFLCVRRALAGMRQAGYGRVVTVSSAAGIDGGDTACAHYAASKGGVIAFTKALSREVVADGVTANVVAPRNVLTPMIAEAASGLPESSPVGRLGTPDDVAAAVAYLCSAHASYVTGEVLALGGGSL